MEKFRPQQKNPTPSPERQPQGGGSKSRELDLSGQAEDAAAAPGGRESTSVQPPENQPRPGVWDVLELHVRRDAAAGTLQMTSEQYAHELREVNQLEDEIYEKGTDHDRLIIRLYNKKTLKPGMFPNPTTFRHLSPEEFQKFRSKAETLSEVEISEEIRQLNEQRARQLEEYHKRHKDGPRRMPRLTNH